jgi:hypothetical protein
MTQGLFPIKELFFWPDQLGPPNVAYQEIQDILRADSSHSIPYYVLWGDQWIGPLVLYLNDLQYTRRINTPVLSTVEGDYVPQPDGSLHGPLQGVRGGYNSNGGRYSTPIRKAGVGSSVRLRRRAAGKSTVLSLMWMRFVFMP